MRRALWGLLVLLAATMLPAGGGAAGATVSLTFAFSVEYGGGTGAIGSPAALCETGTDGLNLRRLSDRIGSLSDPAWAPAGSKLAFAAYDPATHRYSIQVTPASSWHPVVVARSTARLAHPSWSPDAARLAYASTSSNAPGIYAVKDDGTRNGRLYAGAASTPSWSPDGSTIVFAANGIRLMDADGRNVHTISADGVEPAWSSDGKRIAFVANVSQFGSQDVFTVSTDGSGRTQLSHLSPSPTGGFTYVGVPAWSPDGSTIAALHTVEHPTGKGSYYERDLVLLDPSTGTASSVKLPLAFGDPAWRATPPPSTTEAARRPCAILAGDGGVRVKGTAYDDLIVTGAGNDAIDAGSGNDWVEAGAGDDRIVGGPGRDEIWSGPGNDRELVRDGARDIVHCGDFPRDVVEADRADAVLGRCKRIERH